MCTYTCCYLTVLYNTPVFLTLNFRTQNFRTQKSHCFVFKVLLPQQACFAATEVCLIRDSPWPRRREQGAKPNNITASGTLNSGRPFWITCLDTLWVVRHCLYCTVFYCIVHTNTVPVPFRTYLLLTIYCLPSSLSQALYMLCVLTVCRLCVICGYLITNVSVHRVLYNKYTVAIHISYFVTNIGIHRLLNNQYKHSYRLLDNQ